MSIDFPDPSISTTYTNPTNGNTYVYANGSWSLTNVLSATKGGTGFASYTQGDILFGNSSGSLSKLTAGTSGYVLSTNGSGADPTWIAMSSSAGTVAIPSASSLFAYYSSTGASVKATTGIQYTNTSGLLMTITGQSTSQQALKVAGSISGSTTPIFSVDGSSGSQFLVINSLAGQDGIIVAINPSSVSATWAFLVNNSSGDTRFQVDTNNNLVQLKKGTELQLFESTGTYYTGFKATAATASKTYILPPTTPSSGTSVLQTDSSGNLSWVLMSASGGGAGTVATPGSSGKIAYYASTGASVKDATGLDYATSANILTVTSQNTTDVVLQLKGLSSSQTGSALIYKKDGTNNSFVVDKDGYVSVGEWRSTVVSPTYGGTGQNTYTDGQLLIGNSNTSSLSKSTLSAGVGITVTNGNGSITIVNSRPVVLNLASGFTPVGIGTDYNILRVPEGKNNTNASYNIKKVVMGVGTTSSGTSTIRLEKSAGPHTNFIGFSLSSSASTWNAMSADLSLLTGLGETSWISFASGYGTVATGDRMRLNFTAVDSTHANFIVQVLLEEY